jgi:heme/copper-type cytochrome/quinol oxidase subunit 1
MNLKKIKVYHAFWIVAVLILIIGLLQNNDPEAFLDINFHDTYYVIRNLDCTIFLSSCYFLMGLGYWLLQKVFKKQLVKYLTIIHSVVLIGSFVFYWMVIFYSKLFITENSFPFNNNYISTNTTLLIEFLLIIFIAMPVYIVNLLIGLFRKNTEISCS